MKFFGFFCKTRVCVPSVEVRPDTVEVSVVRLFEKISDVQRSCECLE